MTTLAAWRVTVRTAAQAVIPTYAPADAAKALYLERVAATKVAQAVKDAVPTRENDAVLGTAVAAQEAASQAMAAPLQALDTAQRKLVAALAEVKL